MKFVKLAFHEITIEGVGKVLKKHKFDFVRYGKTGDWFMEPTNAGTAFDIDTNSPVGAGVENVYIMGIEVLNQTEASGFDEPRDL